MKTLTFSTVSSASAQVQSWPAPFAQLGSWLVVLHRCNPVLSWPAWLHVALLVVALLAMPFDDRVITGTNAWIKPAKFAISGAIYLWTLGWLLADLPAATQRAVRRISWGVATALMVEIAAIYVQAVRGTTSHYNISSPLNALLFGLMGIFIMLNTALIIWTLFLVWRHRPHGSVAYVWGVRLGVLLFLVGSAMGGMMIHQNAHTVGTPDGGPGLLGLGWSTRAGDLRIAHFLGLHALQLVPLAGWLLGRYLPRRAVAGTWLFALTYAALTGFIFWEALQGIPLWAR
ncbi:hypothetical protein [Hymenobacter cavernae]|uniref:DUF2306 domain-containing protein n=1 Tax=Hymenobacter cavernae TaxID=2044852 RepID=A0ABQ1UQV7_9BACT|nr:hypothetical protein [Hymenobacter cavernae]GGF24340.1 hypothetical protein GCM10011383_39960 [Hymenobacter cavernae]